MESCELARNWRQTQRLCGWSARQRAFASALWVWRCAGTWCSRIPKGKTPRRNKTPSAKRPEATQILIHKTAIKSSSKDLWIYDAFCMMLYDALCRSMSSSDFTVIHSLCGSPACIAKTSSFSAAASLAVSLGKLRQAISRLDLEDSKAAKKTDLAELCLW